MSKRIFEIKQVELEILESFPPQLMITAHGLASSSGWKNPTLALLNDSPPDGIYEYEFLAEPPSGISLDVLTKITAVLHLSEIPNGFKGARVLAASNTIEVKEASEVANTNLPPIRVIEPLLGATFLEDRLVLRVRSGGCTQKEHFKIEINTGFTGLSPAFATIYRIKEDRCKAFIPNGVEVIFPFDEIGLENGSEIMITNPIGLKPIPAAIRFPELEASIPWPWPINPPPLPWPWPPNPWAPFGPSPINPFGFNREGNGI